MKPPGFIPFPKISRLKRDIVVTEKIDGTNGVIFIPDAVEATMYPDPIYAGSRSRWVTPGKGDNMGFAAWVYLHATRLVQELGPGYHYGEWWGQGIQRGYGVTGKRFSLFNPFRYTVPLDALYTVVPVLYEGPFSEFQINWSLLQLSLNGSSASPGYLDPEGIVVYHCASKATFKVTINNDAKPKGGDQ